MDAFGCVILAAGNGSRFGGNKLLADFRGGPTILRAFAAIPPALAARTVAVTQYDAVDALAREYGFGCVRNPAPELGVSLSIRLGTEAVLDAAGGSGVTGILYLVADQPLLTRETVLRLLEAFRADPDRIVVPTAGDRQGNPCVFPKDLFPALLALTGDRGGKQIIRQHPERVTNVEVPIQELCDVDTLQELEDFQKLQSKSKR